MPKLKTCVPTLLALSGLAMSSIFGASEAETDMHFEITKRLIQREARLVADRSLAEFEKDFLQAGSKDLEILRLHYARIFRVSALGEDAAKLNEEYQRLSKELEGIDVSKLPENRQALLTEDPTAKIIALVNPIMQRVSPVLPVKSSGLTDDEREILKTRIKLLMEAVAASLPIHSESIAAYEDELEKYNQIDQPKQEDYEILFEAIRRRLNLVNGLYFSHRALREVYVQADDYGLDRAEVDAFFKEHLTEWFSKFEDWDWQWGDVNVDFKYRMLSLRLEAARNHGIKYAEVDSAKGYLDEFLETPLEVYKGADMRKYVKNLYQKTRIDAMYWYSMLAIAEESSEKRTNYHDQIMKYWGQIEREVSGELFSSNKRRSYDVGQMYLQSARLLAMIGKKSEALALVNAIIKGKNSKKHQADYNAKLLQRWILKSESDSGADAGSGWAQVPKSMDPETTLSIGHAMFKTATTTADAEKARGYMMQAISTLRNGIMGLSDPQFSDKIVTHGPQVYQLYAFLLNEIGWNYHAALAAQQGVSFFQPLWERRKNEGGNPWGDPNNPESLSDAGRILQRLASTDYSRYARILKNNDDSKLIREMYTESLEIQGVFGGGGGAKSLIIAKIQEKKYDEAVELSEKYIKDEAKNENDRFFGMRMIVYALYLNAYDLRKDEAKLKEALVQLEVRNDELKKATEAELAKGPEAVSEAAKAKQLSLSVVVFKNEQVGEYDSTIEMLGPAFWENPPSEGTLQMRMASSLCRAVYRKRIAISKDKEAQEDPAVILNNWEAMLHAKNVLLTTRENVKSKMTGSTKMLAIAFQSVSRNSQWLLDNGELSGADRGKLIEIARVSTIHYIDLFAPTLPADTSIEQYLGLGNDLWKVGAKVEAAPYFERYLNGIAGDESIAAFSDDPIGVVDAVGNAVISARSQYRKDWNVIRDYLIDEPGFMELYIKPASQRGDLKEEKRDFAQAYGKIREFRKQLEGQVALLSNGKELIAQVDGLQELVKHLSQAVLVKMRLVEVYNMTGRLQESVALARELYEYDPLYPPFMSGYVEGTIQIIGEASEADRKQALEVANRIRSMVREDAKQRQLFWTSFCQVMELRASMNILEPVNRALQQNAVNNYNPAEDLYIGGTDPRQARDAGAAALAKRYLKIFELSGVHGEPPYSVEEQDGVTVFIPRVKEAAK